MYIVQQEVVPKSQMDGMAPQSFTTKTSSSLASLGASAIPTFAIFTYKQFLYIHEDRLPEWEKEKTLLACPVV